MIKEIEDRISWYKQEMKAVNMDKTTFAPQEEQIISYLSLLREAKNRNEKLLKKIIEYKTNEKQGLNPLCYYKYLN